MEGEETDYFVKIFVSLRREIKPGIFLGQLDVLQPSAGFFRSSPQGVCLRGFCSVPPGNAEPKRRLFPTSFAR